MQIPWTLLSFVVVIILGFKTAWHFLKPSMNAIKLDRDPSAEDMRKEKISVYLFFSSFLLLFYTLFMYLLPWAWPIFMFLGLWTLISLLNKIDSPEDWEVPLHKERPRKRVLRAFLWDTERERTTREISTKAKVGYGAHHVLRKLEQEGILKSRVEKPNSDDEHWRMYFTITADGIVRAKSELEIDE